MAHIYDMVATRTRPFSYGTRMLKAGDPFRAPERDEKVLRALKLARRASSDATETDGASKSSVSDVSDRHTNSGHANVSAGPTEEGDIPPQADENDQGSGIEFDTSPVSQDGGQDEGDHKESEESS